ncbi:MAG: hypothetical protein IPP40_12115 [bacterium]|nr:hypothetical protein [bacterium]
MAGKRLRSHASRVGENMNAFEVLVGPYAVAHMRLTQAILDKGGMLPPEGAQIYLTDTLESPNLVEERQDFLFQKRLTIEHKRTESKIGNAKRSLGNPPYDRQERERGDTTTQLKGGWVRFGEGDAQSPQTSILSDFLEPASKSGKGGHLRNLYNDYVYFWRWALWKVFEQNKKPGVVSFITASSYLKGPGFVGMREHMRRVLDELWIIDLEGDNLGARKSENVFAIQTPVAIAVVVRYKKGKPETPAKVWYTKISGTRKEKLSVLAGVKSVRNLKWQECPKGWQEIFIPKTKGDYSAWPKLTDIFPWQHSGMKYHRTWTIGESQEVLEVRWRALMRASIEERRALFMETGDRKIQSEYRNPFGNPRVLPAIETLKSSSPCPTIIRLGYRSFDRQYCILDNRLGDRLRPVLTQVYGKEQVYITSLLTKVLGDGLAATATANVPDIDHFCNRGGKDIIPLYRDGGGISLT